METFDHESILVCDIEEPEIQVFGIYVILLQLKKSVCFIEKKQ